MKITLIEPAVMLNRHFHEKSIWMLQPLSLARLAGLTPPDVEIEMADERVEPIDFDAPRDLVGISVKTYTARRAYQIAAEFRRRGVRVILGGFHPTLLPEEAQQHADAVVVGEAELLWPAIVADARAGRLQPLYRQDGTLPFRAVPTDRRPLAGKRYLPVTLVEITRGCPYRCSFCSVTQFFGGDFRSRPVAEVVAEIAANPNPLYLFTDDNIAGDRRYARELLRALIPLKIRWVSQASLTVARDEELLDLLAASGCLGLLIGIESTSPENLRQAGKGWNLAGAGYAEALGRLRARHIAVVGSFILGMDGDTSESLDALLDFALEQRFAAVLFNLLTPFPGTQLYADFVRAGRMRQPAWWVDDTFRYGFPSFEPRHMTAAALAEKRMALYRRFYGPRSILGRSLDFQANMHDPWHVLAYLALNLPAYMEEKRRLGLPLGKS